MPFYRLHFVLHHQKKKHQFWLRDYVIMAKIVKTSPSCREITAYFWTKSKIVSESAEKYLSNKVISAKIHWPWNFGFWPWKFGTLTLTYFRFDNTKNIAHPSVKWYQKHDFEILITCDLQWVKNLFDEKYQIFRKNEKCQFGWNNAPYQQVLV